MHKKTPPRLADVSLVGGSVVYQVVPAHLTPCEDLMHEVRTAGLDPEQHLDSARQPQHVSQVRALSNCLPVDLDVDGRWGLLVPVRGRCRNLETGKAYGIDTRGKRITRSPTWCGRRHPRERLTPAAGHGAQELVQVLVLLGVQRGRRGTHPQHGKHSNELCASHDIRFSLSIGDSTIGSPSYTVQDTGQTRLV